MKILYRGCILNYDRHRTLIFTAHIPNCFEKFFLRRKIRFINYLGGGSKWRIFKYNGVVQLFEIDVTEKHLVQQLQAWENGEKFYKRNKK